MKKYLTLILVLGMGSAASAASMNLHCEGILKAKTKEGILSQQAQVEIRQDWPTYNLISVKTEGLDMVTLADSKNKTVSFMHQVEGVQVRNKVSLLKSQWSDADVSVRVELQNLTQSDAKYIGVMKCQAR